jgi:RNA polymerase sigma factor (sigma-70 family)
MTALTDWHNASDAELACAAAAGDRGAFAGIYDRYADRLHDFCIGMLRDRDAAADCVQDTFVKAAQSLPQLREPDRLKSWLYTIARRRAVDLINARRREQPTDDVPEMPSTEPDFAVMAARNELADLIGTACGGLTDRDRTVLELAYRHGLEGQELADALDVSHANAKKLVQRLRDTIERSLGAVLVSRRWRDNVYRCPDLAAILDGWDGQFTVLMRKRIARHIESCPACDEERRRLVSPAALLGAAPAFIPAPAWLRERTLDTVNLGQGPADAQTAESADDRPGEESPGKPVRRRLLVAAALVMAVVGISVALTIAWLQEHHANLTPADVTGTATTTPPTGMSTPEPTESIAPQVSQAPTTQAPTSVSVPANSPASSTGEHVPSTTPVVTAISPPRTPSLPVTSAPVAPPAPVLTPPTFTSSPTVSVAPTNPTTTVATPPPRLGTRPTVILHPTPTPIIQ